MTLYDSFSMTSHYSYEAERETKNETRSKHPGERPLDPVWKHFAATPLKSLSHFFAICKYCNTQFSHGHPNELEVHLAKECEDESLDDEIRSKYLEIVVQRQLSKKKLVQKINQKNKK
ncbi:92_t:CDS:1 [Cetraspora pellucida]|uniref:92_t:CDS:1 n=1 Tax=Cetraspora pellucida TaxID=1433469 RepID=A0A9N9K2U0_9GLOM|nr:92_t:CDS:1 [Cetraspora pellucida]